MDRVDEDKGKVDEVVKDKVDKVAKEKGDNLVKVDNVDKDKVDKVDFLVPSRGPTYLELCSSFQLYLREVYPAYASSMIRRLFLTVLYKYYYHTLYIYIFIFPPSWTENVYSSAFPVPEMINFCLIRYSTQEQSPSQVARS